ncbi:1-acyl-sn-glycerol-3-phosphate acyltransferase [Aestuariivirga sp.]|uniref:lysophospholipid acyltransferase family protein n=1 Tax=Aestuariivirga sp. TaxID=2650926 RepID=UPI0025BFF78D|nr:lysophospholipid acyltransferase family protein [Aestuariivirga sp.]
MIYLRSALFNVVFYINLALFLVLGSGFYVTPRKWSIRALQLWARASLFWLRTIAGIRLEVRGKDNIPQGACLVAGKHQSFWETFAILPLLDDPAMVLKRELTYIPFFGWFIHKFRMIPVERSAGTQALRTMIDSAEKAIAMGRQVVIMPEGTRRGPDDPPDYKPGAAALYGKLGVPCVPFALNSGLFWPRRQFLRWPGTVVISFLPPIPPGLTRKAFQSRLEAMIETETARLVAEGRSGVHSCVSI